MWSAIKEIILLHLFRTYFLKMKAVSMAILCLAPFWLCYKKISSFFINHATSCNSHILKANIPGHILLNLPVLKADQCYRTLSLHNLCNFELHFILIQALSNDIKSLSMAMSAGSTKDLELPKPTTQTVAYVKVGLKSYWIIEYL